MSFLRKGDYEVHNGHLVKFNWLSRRHNWDTVRPLTRWEHFLAAFFRVFPRID